METRQVRRAKEREGERPDVHLKRHLGERPEKFPRVPKTKREMQMHLSGKHPHFFRDPQTRKEKRDWEKYWQYKGKGFTK